MITQCHISSSAFIYCEVSNHFNRHPLFTKRAPMDLLRNFLWLWVIIVTIFAWIVISLIFIFINKCISRAGKHRITQFPRTSSDFTAKSNPYQERTFEAETPPLPPRHQFLTAEAQSYENLAEEYVQNFSDYKQSIPNYVQDVPDYEQSIPDYVQDVPDYEQSIPDYVQDVPDYEQSIPDYVQDVPDYEQDKQSDYVMVEDEDEPLPLPPRYQDADPVADNSFEEEDYDDIGGEDENEGDEDYDDVG
ncbi:uncharacterized protein LOC117742935 isoform X1 [Cyclopterus lumpus]|uniref:uncharacterized protein LOC117742935 isoform X1 n=1 Tax=Cyclopterus lumpus TaxID=8103 RepID=UPI001486322C|nr:uncharacterized protein LOC117742935 isoform X1 [Cyclopterus lumpus]